MDRLLFEVAPAFGALLLAASVALQVAGLSWQHTSGLTFGSLSFFAVPCYFWLPTVTWWWRVAGADFYWALDGEEVIYGLGRSRKTLAWDEFGAWTETPEFFLLFLRSSPQQYHTLPRRALAPCTQDQLRTLLRRQLGGPR